jgi:hypothetical protein
MESTLKFRGVSEPKSFEFLLGDLLRNLVGKDALD